MLQPDVTLNASCVQVRSKLVRLPALSILFWKATAPEVPASTINAKGSSGRLVLPERIILYYGN